MTGQSKEKPNYNDSQYNHEYEGNKPKYENSFGEQSYLPANYDYDRKYTESFYEDRDSAGAGSFLFGALVGGVIGAAAALFLAPKTGSEMRGDFSSQAGQLKDKSIELSSVAKQKATEFTSAAKEKTSDFTSVAKEKTGELTKTIQEQSGQLVDKVKTMTSKTSAPMDDGTVSSEGEEAINFVESSAQVAEEDLTATAEALIKAVGVNDGDSKAAENGSGKYDNSMNIGEDKNINQNALTDIKEESKK